MNEPEQNEEGYAGPATLLIDDDELKVIVNLRGHFEPIDGYYHWYGRVATHEELSILLSGKKKVGTIRTPVGEATAQLSDPDPWDRYRITGKSTPPFQVSSAEHQGTV